MSPPVHVLHVVRTLGKGGGMEMNLYRVVVALRARGIRHSIALLSSWPDIIDFGEHAPVIRLVSRDNDPRLILRLRDVVRELKPTVIHSRNWGAWPDVALARLTLAGRPPLVFSYHGSETAEISPRRRLSFRAMASITDRFFAVSEASRRLLIDGFGLAGRPIDVIPNGVDAQRFRPREEARAPGPLVVGTAGRMMPVKNMPLLVRAVARLRQEGLDVVLRIAGDGPEIGRVRALCEQTGLGARAHLLGQVEDVPAFLRSLDVFALPSENEAHPNALLEGMATGLPCVATAVGGVPEVLEHGGCGRLVPPNDEEALASSLRELTMRPELRAELGGAARRQVLARYSQEAMLDAYEALYRHPVEVRR